MLEFSDPVFAAPESRHSLFAKRPTQVALAQNAALPLHVQIPAVPFLSWKNADAVMRDAARKADANVWFSTTKVYREQNAAQTIFANREKNDDVFTDALLHNDDLEKLLSSGFAIPTDLDTASFEQRHPQFAYVRLFSVVESKPEGDRRRVIAWPKSLNEAERRVIDGLAELGFKVAFSSASEIRDRGVRFKYAASLDFKKFFQQFQLEVPNFWAFKKDKKVYLLSSIPTGAVFPPLFANALSRTMLALAVRRANSKHTIEHDCCIDNLRLVSDDLASLRCAWKHLLSICATVGCTIGEANPPPTQLQRPYVYLGIHFEQIENVPTAQLAEKSKQKLNHAMSLISSSRPVLVVDVLALFGQTVWACTVTDFKLGKLYHVIKYVRRIQRKQLHDVTHIWPSIVDVWHASLLATKTLVYKPKGPIDINVTMYTDASESGWGVVILDLGDRPMRVFAGRWSENESGNHQINHLELRAVRIGIRHLAEIKRDLSINHLAVEVLIDNTSAEAWAKRSRAPRFASNAVALEIGEICAKSKITMTTKHVESARNLADEPSRRFQQHMDKTTASAE